MRDLHSRQARGTPLEKSLEWVTVKSRWSSEISSFLCQFVTGEMGKNGRGNGPSCASCHCEGKSVCGRQCYTFFFCLKVVNLQVSRWIG